MLKLFILFTTTLIFGFEIQTNAKIGIDDTILRIPIDKLCSSQNYTEKLEYLIEKCVFKMDYDLLFCMKEHNFQNIKLVREKYNIWENYIEKCYPSNLNTTPCYNEIKYGNCYYDEYFGTGYILLIMVFFLIGFLG